MRWRTGGGGLTEPSGIAPPGRVRGEPASHPTRKLPLPRHLPATQPPQTQRILLDRRVRSAILVASPPLCPPRQRTRPPVDLYSALGLAQEPFSTTADPAFMYASQEHREALL